MNTLHYDYFIAIAENKTLSQAARTLHVSQSVLSRYLKNLEEETGIRLFLTSSGCYTLTQAHARSSCCNPSFIKSWLFWNRILQTKYVSEFRPSVEALRLPIFIRIFWSSIHTFRFR